jgi:hypothetical protein
LGFLAALWKAGVKGRACPIGFRLGTLPGTITPSEGQHAGVPMVRGSALAAALIRVMKRRSPMVVKSEVVKPGQREFDEAAPLRGLKANQVPKNMRTPDGDINNCALQNEGSAVGCQMCGGVCPDAPPAEGTPPPPGSAEADKKITPPEMPAGYERIITKQFQVANPFEEYEELRSYLRFKGRASALGYGELQDALNEIQEHAYRAGELAANAKVALIDYEHDVRVITGPMRENARTALERHKAELKAETKLSGKSITDADVEAEIAALHPDEWGQIKRNLTKWQLMVSLLSDLADKLGERARDLRAMVSHSRAVD